MFRGRSPARHRMRGQTLGDPTGPAVTTPPSVSPETAQEGTQVTRTQGIYAALGGGSVSITTSEWRLDGAQVGTGATYTPTSGNVGGVLSYYEVATESGGSAPGITVRQVVLGTVQAAAGGSDNLEMDADPMEWNGDQLIFNAA